MNEGTRFHCTSCGETAFAKKKKIMDSWTIIGEKLVCSFCGAAVPEEENGNSAVSERKNAEISPAKSSLLAFFGEDEAPVQKRPVFEEAEKHFCRDCAFSVANPFAVICTRSGEEVQPMADCAAFQAKGKKNVSFQS